MSRSQVAGRVTPPRFGDADDRISAKMRTFRECIERHSVKRPDLPRGARLSAAEMPSPVRWASGHQKLGASVREQRPTSGAGRGRLTGLFDPS